MALDVLRRIEDDGAYANLALGPALAVSGLSDADRRFATELVYGSTRMRRACDALMDRYVSQPPDAATRSILRLGVYQLVYAGVPPHAAVNSTVELAPRRTRGFVNAVLRKVAAAGDSMAWPSAGARLSYPDWIVELLAAELGDDAPAALERMNEPPPVTARPDGYVQDVASQWVAAAVEAVPGDRILDVCAAPGGKATALSAAGATVVAADVRPRRAALVRENAVRLGRELPIVVADGTSPPFAAATFDAVLLDAPCSGLGALRRRPDARWRIAPADVQELAGLQARLLTAGAGVVRPGGRLVYSVCTLTAAESVDHATPAGFEIDGSPLPVGTWRPFGQGWRVLPQDADTDGMVVIRYRRTS
ncbi:MAG: methyltransferase domain-containing protein [Ilumatobacter sp.]|nr:methyltransferase domain-containing protein [Ilumatobacter sp.]